MGFNFVLWVRIDFIGRRVSDLVAFVGGRSRGFAAGVVGGLA